jgi:glycerol-3-phosphate dehydrogenase
MADYDLALIGGGLTGAAIARDAAGRGLKVILVEQGDLASGASQASSGLIAGIWSCSSGARCCACARF